MKNKSQASRTLSPVLPVCFVALLLFPQAAQAQTQTATDKSATDEQASDKPATEKPATDNPIAENTAGQPALIKEETVKLSPNKISVTMGVEDIVCTNDVALAKKQVESYPDSPEASFIYAVALSRTANVEGALKEVRRARRLAEGQGGPSYFDKMIESYEKMLTYYPDDNQVRYHLAWAYYMKAYVLAKYAPRVSSEQKYKEWIEASQAAPKAVSLQIANYYALATAKLDDLLARDPGDIWARIYRAHLTAEASGNVDSALAEWQKVREIDPTNPAPYFFLGQGYLKKGNLKECLFNVSKAVSLRGPTAQGTTR